MRVVTCGKCNFAFFVKGYRTKHICISCGCQIVEGRSHYKYKVFRKVN